MHSLKSRFLFLFIASWPKAFSASRRHRAFLYAYAKTNIENRGAWWVQVGANDGGDWDPVAVNIRQFNIKALLIEPVSYLFSKLKVSYGKHRRHCIFERLAIGNQSGTVILHTLDPEKLNGLPGWSSQISSIKNEVLLRHKGEIEGLETKLSEESVTIKPLKNVLTDHNIQQVDFLQIDTEGFDAEVLMAIDFEKTAIRLISFEHKHLSQNDYQATLLLLEKYGFTYLKFKGDTFAWQENDGGTGKMVRKYLGFS